MTECRNSQVAQVDYRGDREHRTPNIPRPDELCYDNTKHRWVPRFQNVRPKYCGVTMANTTFSSDSRSRIFGGRCPEYIWGLNCDGREMKRGYILASFALAVGRLVLVPNCVSPTLATQLGTNMVNMSWSPISCVSYTRIPQTC